MSRPLFLYEIGNGMDLVFSQHNPEDSVLALKERIKELSCLYRIAELASRLELDTKEVLQACVDFIPDAMQYPEKTAVRLTVENSIYKTKPFFESGNLHSAELSTQFSTQGLLEVFYPDEDAYQLLPEEYKLIETIAQQISLILERHSIQDYNAKMQEQLRHADRLATIGQLSAGIAHEINEPLSAILGFSQLVLSENELTETAQQDMQKIVNATLHAREVVRKLMLFSRQVPPKMVPVNLNKLLVEGFYFLENRCEKQGVTIVRNLDKDLPMVIANPGQIHQVLVNLSVNAMQAMPNGGNISISTRTVRNNVEIKIADTGIGMDNDILQKIFIPFFTTKDIDQGTGLGLSVVHGIISAHNAQIKVKSTPGKGSEFTIVMKAHYEKKH